ATEDATEKSQPKYSEGEHLFDGKRWGDIVAVDRGPYGTSYKLRDEHGMIFRAEEGQLRKSVAKGHTYTVEQEQGEWYVTRQDGSIAGGPFPTRGHAEEDKRKLERGQALRDAMQSIPEEERQQMAREWDAAFGKSEKLWGYAKPVKVGDTAIEMTSGGG